jgi:hypothetical protein
MTMKKALLFIVAVVIIFNSTGFFATGQDSLLETEALSVVHASDEVDNGAFDADSAHVAGMEADNPISMTHFTMLISLMILIPLIVNKSNQ